ncbi:MAG: pyridine nucleotide-disulfide oxidoreductase [Peptococcaceae bacterium BICA1-8]|nr:MAG: pyridine nucleotide-disulfide oxidoreductase [Peptococcaceae bacterium BICA1-8]
MHYVIIGNSAAAVGAVEGIRRVDKHNPITLISDEPYHTYSRPLISYLLAGKVTEEKMLYRGQDFYEKNNVTTLLGQKAIAIDTDSKAVKLENNKVIIYDKLLIATGGTPFIPPMDGLEKKNVFTFIKMADVKAISDVVVAGNKAVIIGAGLIGLKAAEGLASLGVDVTIVELANRVLSAILDEEGADIVQKNLEKRGIKFELNTSVKAITGGEEAQGVTLSNGKALPADLVVVAVGVRPNTEVVESSKITVNRGIVIDEKCQTSIENVYAAGDVAEGYDLIFAQNRVLPILPNAYCQGETAGLNMAGSESIFSGGFAMNSIGFYGLPMITAGIVKPEGDGYEVLVKMVPEQNLYKKIILKDNIVVGFIYLNEVDRAGIITGLIREKTNVSDFKQELLKDSFGYIDLPQKLRRSKLLKGDSASCQ